MPSNSPLRSKLCLTFAVAILSISPSFGAKPPADVQGKVRFYQLAGTKFDSYSERPSEADKDWMRNHYLRMQTYSSYFDSRLAWYPNAWVYKDAYAIFPGSTVHNEHPEWVLKDADGNELFIPWGCSNGTCPQYAADIGNPMFRKHWIGKAKTLLDKGYKGLWIDDVNLTWRVGDNNGDHVKPIDIRTGKEMSLDDWRRYFAEFMEEIRASFPNAEIAHNAIWYAGSVDDPNIRRQIAAADYYNLERGATDSGLKAGSGAFGFETFLGFIDTLHERGTSVILMDYGKTVQQRDYGLAAWFLISDGSDLMNSNQLDWTAPDKWWSGYGLNLGLALGPRIKSDGLLRRDFSCGVVLLNQPGRPTEYFDATGENLSGIDGQDVTTVALVGGSAAILKRECDDGLRPRPPTDLITR